MRVTFWANTHTQAALTREAEIRGLSVHQIAKRIVDEWAGDGQPTLYPPRWEKQTNADD